MENLLLVLWVLLIIGLIIIFGFYIKMYCKQLKILKIEYHSAEDLSTKNVLLESCKHALYNIISTLAAAVVVIGIVIALGFVIIPDLF